MTTKDNVSSTTSPESDDRPLVSRSTIVILLSFQTGMILGNGVPTNLASMVYLGVAVSVVEYLAVPPAAYGSLEKKQSQKKHCIARQVDRRIRSHIIDKPVSGHSAPKQPRLRSTADFVPVVSDWS